VRTTPTGFAPTPCRMNGAFALVWPERSAISVAIVASWSRAAGAPVDERRISPAASCRQRHQIGSAYRSRQQFFELRPIERRGVHLHQLLSQILSVAGIDGALDLGVALRELVKGVAFQREVMDRP